MVILPWAGWARAMWAFMTPGVPVLFGVALAFTLAVWAGVEIRGRWRR